MRRSLIGTALIAVSLCAGSWSPQTPTPARDPNAFFFLQLSDPQFGMFTADADFGQEVANFTFAVAQINRLKPAFAVITGDLVNRAGDTAEMAAYVRIRKTIAPNIPVYDMPGNHDVGNTPTPASLAAYRAWRGPDHYTFHYRSLTGLVLNSSIISAPDNVPQALADQDMWLRQELARAHAAGVPHIVIFQHHPWFLASADEPDGYFNIPRARRDPLLALFRASGVGLLVSGHYHRNADALVDGLEAVTTGPVGKPLEEGRSGMRAFLVTDQAITHRYLEFGNMPTRIDPASGSLDDAQAKP